MFLINVIVMGVWMNLPDKLYIFACVSFPALFLAKCVKSNHGQILSEVQK